MRMNLAFDEDVYIEACNDFNTAITDGDFPASGSYIDVSDLEGFVFLVKAGTLNSALTCKVQQATADDGTPKDVTGASFTVAADGDDQVYGVVVETRRLDINGGYHYVTLDVSGAAGSDDYLDILFLGLNQGVQPVTQHSATNTFTRVLG